MEFRRQDQPFNTVTNDQEDDDDDQEEAQWFAEMRRRPWRRRPSMSWLVPWVVMHGINFAMCDSPLEQLKIMRLSAARCFHDRIVSLEEEKATLAPCWQG